jgi:site-specific DNA-methyltransferase (adenine-specific)
MDPYYQDNHCTIYHGDCRDIIDGLEFDVIVTDPPYGISLQTDYSGLNGSTRSYSPIVGDDSPIDVAQLIGWGPIAMFGAHHHAANIPSGGTWHVWDKRENSAPNMFADFETWWTSYPTGPSRIFRYQWVAGCRPGGTRRNPSQHPTAKPVPVMMNIITEPRTPAGTVLDPFMGSGTTLRAAKDLGRKAIGVEIEERYCEIAARRMGQEVLAFDC